MRLFALIVFAAISTLGMAQDYSFITYSNGQGLPQSQVQCITQDDDGYLWVGTLGGLAKFNGKNFTTFPLEQGLFNNRISCLQHIQKTIWVGHEGGITQITNNRAQSYSLGDDDRTVIVTDFIQYQGKIIASTEGSGLYIISNNHISKVTLKNADASTCRDLEVVNGKLYIGTRDGLYFTKDLTNFNHVEAFKDRRISGIALTKTHVFISTSFEGLFKSDLNFKKFDSIPVQSEDLYIGKINSDKSNQLWLSSPEGVIRLSSQMKQLNLNETNGLPVNTINCSFQDKEGNIWFGSDGKGLIRFANQNLQIYSTKTGMPSDLILSGTKLKSGTYLFGSYDKGAFKMNLQGVCEKIPIPATTIWDIEYFNGLAWFATDMGIFSWDFKSEPINYYFKGRTKTFRVLKPFRNRLIVASEESIGYIENNTLHHYSNFKFNPSKNGNIRDIAFYYSNILVATSKGLYELNLSKNTQKLLRNFKASIASIEIDVENRIWIGTENGLVIFDGINYKDVSYSSKSGARFINFIHRVESNIFIGTNDGLYVFDNNEGSQDLIKHIGTNNGLINLESNINSSLFEDGNFWFGTSDGLAKLHIGSSEVFSDFPPKLNIARVLVNYREINPSEIYSGLKLNYSKNNLIIDLDGISMEDPESVTFQYWLDGESDKWSPPTLNPTIILSNLDAGNYTLHIRAISGTKKISEISSFAITITPPFWRTWWFYILVFIAIAFGIRYYFRLQIKRERDRNYKINLENKSRLLALEQQSLNASMNRHFIFNSLNSIQYFINTQDRVSANRYLTSFAKLIRKNLDSASEGDNVVTLHQELERLELYLSLEAMRFKDRFVYRIDNQNIDLEQVTVPAMLLQPFVENSIIHGILPDETKKGEILVTIKALGDQLEICIDDNGIGIDYSLNKKAKFKGDHKSQGMEITSKRIDLIREMWNKDYELIGPFQMTNPDRSIKGTRVLIKIPYENLEMND
ncbi:MAG: signal transduction histidine kinase, LytS [Fluviicola sp.]|jgi:ligand-binding sensor domain-containing protein/two-component sensor histidine kinase|uniref:sensor histidine kinase n=1 Tax=Fluviicola sp. TaxID=1917219 RepID=UPI002604546D|nr:two-component regulator propeller domain-containing protein [Fluviicola sp.]MDF3027483.1 signal transduction histidine kinase, LytS [Fluviicola sp.]